MNEGRDQPSSNMAGEMHQTLTIHSQSQKNALGIGNHPDSALDQNNNVDRNIAYGTYHRQEGGVTPSHIVSAGHHNQQIDIYSDNTAA